jgi:predicted component of type VI protein secretion system
MEFMLIGPSEQILLGSTIITIGRLPTNQVTLAGDAQVSSYHAEIRPYEQGYALLDLASTNGTFVNGQQIAPRMPYLLKLGDNILIGQSRFVYTTNSTSRALSLEQQLQWTEPQLMQPQQPLPLPSQPLSMQQPMVLQPQWQPALPPQYIPVRPPQSMPPPQYWQQPPMPVPYYQPAPSMPQPIIVNVSPSVQAQSNVQMSTTNPTRKRQGTGLLGIIFFLIFWPFYLIAAIFGSGRRR